MLKDYPYALLQFYATGPYAPTSKAGRRARRSPRPGTSSTRRSIANSCATASGAAGCSTYRPYCDNCRACIPVRIPVSRFHANRSQRRCWNRNVALEARECALGFREDHYALYQRYQESRHAGGGMDQDSREQYSHFCCRATSKPASSNSATPPMATPCA